MATPTRKYNLCFGPDTDPLEIEFEMIRRGGQWKLPDGRLAGEGMFFHFKEAQILVWPEDDNHRWSNLILQEYLNNRITVTYGSRDSTKTRSISKAALIDYWAFPHETLILMTSTTLRGLELRVWGDVKSLHERGKERYDWLPGNVVDSKHGIFTDKIDEDQSVRDQRKGILCIPVLGSKGEFDGEALKSFAGIKQRRRRWIADECFPSGTPVNTPVGFRAIETIRPGELVLSAIGYRRVIATSIRIATKLLKITMRDGRAVTCTAEHPFLTQHGWKKACELNQEQYILGPYETVPSMRNENKQQGRLFTEMLVQNDGYAGRDCNGLHFGASEEGKGGGIPTHDYGQSYEEQGMFQQGECYSQGPWKQAKCEGRKRNWTNQSRVAIDANVSRGVVELCHQNRDEKWQRIPNVLQSGFSVSEYKIGNRGRWRNPRELGQSETERSKEGRLSCGSWVESVEVLEWGDIGFPKSAENSVGCSVYNLQVEGHPSYCVNGLTTHNCQFIPRDALKVLDSLDKGDFKFAALGNPIAENGKALDAVSEPIGGWDSLGEVTKTRTWKNKYNGVTINLVGIDSPNFDAATLNKFPYMVDQGDVDRVSKRPGGKDSLEWWSQIMGVRKAGAISNRVLTVSEIEGYEGFKDPVWSGVGQRVKIYSIDAGFGGDDCVRTVLEFGKHVDGSQVISFGDQVVIPILMSTGDTPEKQIAKYAKQDCLNLGVPFGNVFVDSGMFATLMVEMARELSPEVNAINFGGTATERPVSNDMFVFDQEKRQRRLKTWYEHVSRFVSELWFVVRLAAQSRQLRKFPRRAAEEFGRRQWVYVSRDRYELETKDDYKLRNGGESPGFADSLVIGVEGARQRGFMVAKIPQAESKVTAVDEWLETAMLRQRKIQQRQTLDYAT